MSESKWHYIDGNNSVGPLDKAGLRKRIHDGLLNRDDLVWQEGMAEWIQARHVPGLLPPPIPIPMIDASSSKQPSVSKSPHPSSDTDDYEGAPQLPPHEASRISASMPLADTTPVASTFEVIDLNKISSDFSVQPQIGNYNLRLAGFWKRLCAFVIDYIFMFGVMFAFFFMLFLVLRMLLESESIMDTYNDDQWNLIGNCSGWLAFWMYFAGMESSRYQGTLGKMALGIKVVDMSGQPISFGRATGRNFGKLISGFILGIGYLMAAFTSKKQGLHDMMAGCIVVNKDKMPTVTIREPWN